jgi:Prokaryotic RING finger family 1
MECVLVGLILVGSVLGLAIVAIASARGGYWNEAFAHVARRFHGVLHPGGWFRAPSVWILHGEAQGRLTVGKIPSSGGERYVQMSIQQRDVRGRCEIFYQQTRPALLPVSRGLSPIEFDWEEFRRRWHVLASDGDEVRHLLTDGVRLAIELAWRQPLPGEMTVSLSPGWMVVRKTWKTPRGLDLEAFVERVCGLSDQLNLAAASGIEFVVGEEPQLLESARCGVCGDNLAEEIVICRRCNTPHHRECWQYGGGCATYGCGGRECFVPGVAPLAAPHWEGQLTRAERPIKPR